MAIFFSKIATELEKVIARIMTKIFGVKVSQKKAFWDVSKYHEIEFAFLAGKNREFETKGVDMSPPGGSLPEWEGNGNYISFFPSFP